MKQNFAVLGAGNGGQVISAYLKLCGKHVTLYDRFPQVLAPIRARGGIQLEGVSKTGFAKLDQICEDVAQAVDGAEIIFVVLPAFAHAYVAQELAGCLVDGQTVVVCPGATGGALEFRAIWDRAGCRSKVRLCETNSLFYAARAQDAVATISGVKDELSLAALAISSVLGSILGILSALKKGSIGDNVLTVFGMIGVSIPQFFFGMLCILVFALDWAILPIGGRMAPGETGIWNHFKYLILPASVLGISLTAGVMRYSRSSMLDTMNKDYIKTARAKGLPEWRVNLVHGFRVALTPVVVLIGFRLPTLIGGSVVIETIFQWPGIGNAFKTAVTGQNYPLVMMIALFSVLAVLMASFLVDILTAVLDPRVKLE